MRIAIVGGGISGLTLAWKLRQRHGASAEITLIEESQRFGGWMQTVHHEGFLFELGPRSCRPAGAGAATLELIEDLGLQDQVIHAAPAAKKRYLCVDGKLVALPTGVFSAVCSPLFRGLCGEWRVPKTEARDESIHAFISRRLGTYAADYLFDPLTLGIYAGDCRKLSMKSCFPHLWEGEQVHGSLTKALLRRHVYVERTPFVKQAQRRGLFTMRHGMEQLATELQGRLKVNCMLGQAVVAVDPSCLRLSDGSVVPFDHCYVTLPANRAAGLFPGTALDSIPHATVTVVNLGYEGKQLRTSGFGYLAPTWTGEPILGVVFDSEVFPEQHGGRDQTRLTVMIRGEASDALAVAIAAVDRHLGIRTAPKASLVTVRRHAIPQFVLGHSERLAASEQEIAGRFPNVHLLGTYQGVAVNDCIARAMSISFADTHI